MVRVTSRGDVGSRALKVKVGFSLTFAIVAFEALLVGVEGTSGGTTDDARVEVSPSLMVGFAPRGSGGTGSWSRVCASVIALLGLP
jgi:hypothetical protein